MKLKNLNSPKTVRKWKFKNKRQNKTKTKTQKQTNKKLLKKKSLDQGDFTDAFY